MPQLRKAAVQVAIVGFLAFCGPGLFNALTGLGNAGSGSSDTSAWANGCLYLCFAGLGYFAGAAFNLLGPHILFMIGGLTYAFYAVCVYFTTPERVWLAAIGGAVLGSGAGLFWTAQGALVMAYSTSSNQGQYIALFWAIFNCGAMLGGILEFAINFNNDKGGANPASYFTFIGLMVAGALSSVVVLISPSKVEKEDGANVEFPPAASVSEELKNALMGIKEPFVKCTVLYFLASGLPYTYDFNGFNAYQFNTRTRGLNSAIFWGSEMLTAVLYGRFLDMRSLTVLARARGGLSILAILVFASYACALLAQFFICGGWDKGNKCAQMMDVADGTASSILAILVMPLLGSADAAFQTYAYWIMGRAAGSSPEKNVRYMAVYKSVQSFGAAIAWLSDLSHAYSYRTQAIVNCSVMFVSFVPVACRGFGHLQPDDAREVTGQEPQATTLRLAREVTGQEDGTEQAKEATRC